MNNDYLWDKKGSDPELERLENILAVFRHQETEPPVLPAAVNIIETPKPLSVGFSFRFAFGAAFAFAVLIIAVFWFQFAETIPNASDVSIVVDRPAEIINASQPSAVIIETNAVKKETVEAKKPHRVNAVYREKKSKSRIPKSVVAAAAKKDSVKLTKEEKFAYSQLLLALSITNEKLRVVGDTINRSGDKIEIRKPVR